MSRYLLLLAGASVFAVSFPSAFERYQARIAAQAPPERLDVPAGASNAALAPAPPLEPRRVALRAGPDGHFRADARLNGRPTAVLVDTGATAVAMSERAAEKLGIALPASAFASRVATANGPARAARVVLDRVAIGSVEVRSVEALVVEGEGLDQVLLGMSFLKRLSRAEVRGDTLVLEPVR